MGRVCCARNGDISKIHFNKKTGENNLTQVENYVYLTLIKSENFSYVSSLGDENISVTNFHGIVHKPSNILCSLIGSFLNKFLYSSLQILYNLHSHFVVLYTP